MSSRRRFLHILAAMPGLAVANRYGFAQAGRNLTAQDVHSWNGTALGADAYISVAHADASEGAKILAACQAEIDSIESIFSLHREESTLSSLNTKGEVSVQVHQGLEHFTVYSQTK